MTLPSLPFDVEAKIRLKAVSLSRRLSLFFSPIHPGHLNLGSTQLKRIPPPTPRSLPQAIAQHFRALPLDPTDRGFRQGKAVIPL